MPSINIYYSKPSDLERKGINAGNMARFVGRNTAVGFIRDGMYSNALQYEPEQLSNEQQLSLDGAKSMLPASSNDFMRNILVLATEDESLQIVFYDCKINVKQQNTIVETALTGKRGSVKEYIQAKDYEIDISGNIISESGLKGFPIDELRVLTEILELPETFKIANVLLRDGFGVDKVVVKSLDFNQNDTNYMNILPYKLTLISDEDYELEID